jgi:hypothetical protein
MKLHFYENQKTICETEFISEGEFHFVKKVKPQIQKKKTRFFLLKK